MTISGTINRMEGVGMKAQPDAVWYSKQEEWIDRYNGVRSRSLRGPNVATQTTLAGMTEMPVEGDTVLHHHNADEFIPVLQGEARVTTNTEVKTASGGDAMLLRAAIKHRYVDSVPVPLCSSSLYGDINPTGTIAATGVILGHLDRYDPS